MSRAPSVAGGAMSSVAVTRDVLPEGAMSSVAVTRDVLPEAP